MQCSTVVQKREMREIKYRKSFNTMQHSVAVSGKGYERNKVEEKLQRNTM